MSRAMVVVVVGGGEGAHSVFSMRARVRGGGRVLTAFVCAPGFPIMAKGTHFPPTPADLVTAMTHLMGGDANGGNNASQVAGVASQLLTVYPDAACVRARAGVGALWGHRPPHNMRARGTGTAGTSGTAAATWSRITSSVAPRAAPPG